MPQGVGIILILAARGDLKDPLADKEFEQEPPAVTVAEPVGDPRARVAIREWPAIMVSGWPGVLVLLLALRRSWSLLRTRPGTG